MMRRCCTRTAWRNLRLYSSTATSKNEKPSEAPRYLIRRMGGGFKRLLGNLTVEGQDAEDEMRAERAQERVERHRQSAARSTVYRPLPLSPLMDPVKIAARERHRTPKKAQGTELTPFQTKLAANPYGM